MQRRLRHSPPIGPGGHKKKEGWGDAIIALTVDYPATQLTFKFKLPSTKTVTLNWGNGSTEDVIGQDAVLITKISLYTEPGLFKFWVSGDVEELTYIDINSQDFVSGNIDRWAELTNLTYLSVWGSGVTITDVSVFATLTSLTNFQISLITATGDASALYTLILATTVWLQITDVGFNGTDGWTNDSADIYLDNCGFTSEEVDNAIAALSTCTNCTIDISGTNAHRTAASNDDLNTLLANGNTITLNDVLGDELYTGLNAANDNATEAITAFADHAATIEGGTKVTQGQDITKMLPLGTELLAHPALDADDWSKDGGWTYDGGDDEYDCDGTNDADLYITEANDDGKYYLLEVTTTGYTSGSLKARYGESDWFTLSFTGNETLSAIIRKEITSDVLEIRSVNYTGSVSNISLKEIEVLGDDLVTNGTFAADTDWARGSGWSIAGGVASCNGSQPSNSSIYQSMPAISSSTVLVKFTVSGYSAGKIVIKYSDDQYIPPFIPGITANGTYTLLFSNGIYGYLYFLCNSDFVGSIDNVSCRKLTVTKEIAASTNYTGTHYVLPEEGEDLDSFIIPVDYVAEAIVAQKITGEYNATIWWDSYASAVISTEETNVDVGLFAIEIESNTMPLGNDCGYITLTSNPNLDEGGVYRISAKIRHVGVGGNWKLGVIPVLTGEMVYTHEIESGDTGYEEKITYFTHNDVATKYFLAKENSVTNDGGVYIDGISIRQVTFP